MPNHIYICRGDALMQDASDCLAALKAKPQAGWFSRKATALAQTVIENLIFCVDNISIKFREFEFAIGSMRFEPSSHEASDGLFSKTANITGLLISCSALGSDAKPVVVFPEINSTVTKGGSGFAVRLSCDTISAEAEPIALRLGISALSGLLLSSFHV